MENAPAWFAAAREEQPEHFDVGDARLPIRTVGVVPAVGAPAGSCPTWRSRASFGVPTWPLLPGIIRRVSPIEGDLTGYPPLFALRVAVHAITCAVLAVMLLFLIAVHLPSLGCGSLRPT